MGTSMTIIEDAEFIAENMLLKFGDLSPFMLVEGTTSRTMVPLNSLPETAQERVAAVFDIGSDMAVQRNVGKLNSVVFVSKGWLAQQKEKSLSGFRPSRDPQRLEAVVIVALQ